MFTLLGTAMPICSGGACSSVYVSAITSFFSAFGISITTWLPYIKYSALILILFSLISLFSGFLLKKKHYIANNFIFFFFFFFLRWRKKLEVPAIFNRNNWLYLHWVSYYFRTEQFLLYYWRKLRDNICCYLELEKIKKCSFIIYC